jgi:hypothetical protein
VSYLSIRERRLDKAINHILREELQKGNLPSSKEFIWRLNQYLQENNISTPEFDFKPARKGSVAKSSDVNKTLGAVYSDFDTLYVNVIEQHNASVKHFNKFDVEKSKLEYLIDELESKLKELILLYGESDYLNSIYDILVDFSQIDSANTTASVDVKNHEVKISDIKSRSSKIIINATSSFEILPEIKTLVEGKVVSGTPADALNNNANNTWQYEVSSESKMDVGGYYLMVLNTKQLINKISLSLHSIKPTYVKPEFSPDNVNWIPLPYYEEGVMIDSEYNFDFPDIEVRQIRLLLAKKEPDAEALGRRVDQPALTAINLSQELPNFPTPKNTDESSRRYFTTSEDGNYYGTAVPNPKSQSVRYTYLFGIKSISLYRNTYSMEGTFYSTKLKVDSSNGKNFTIDRVSLSVEEELPNGTDIKYYIALPPEGVAQPEWKAISPVNRKNPQYDQMIDFKNVSTSIPSRFAIDPTISIGEYEQEHLYANGIRFYKIGEIVDRKIIPGTQRLFVGKDTWGKKSYAYQQVDNATHEPILEDWVRPQTLVTVGYTKIENGKPGLILNKERTSTPTNYIFTLGVFSNKAKEIVNATPASTDPIAVFMNGQLLFQGIPTPATKINYVFESGWNEIIVLVYTSKTVGAVNGATVDLSIDPRYYGSSIYSKAKPLTMVSIFDLRYNTLNINYDNFAVVEVNNKSQIILNNAMAGLDYEFFYNYIDGTVHDEILFKAQLQRDDTITNTSSKIKSYRLRFS